MEYKVLVVLLVFPLLEGTHVALLQRVGGVKPALLKELGRSGPGYYFFGLFWFHPTYRRRLTSRWLASELKEHRQCVGLANAELLLWYLLWVVVLLMAIL
jgi:hypothetical protein